MENKDASRPEAGKQHPKPPQGFAIDFVPSPAAGFFEKEVRENEGLPNDEELFQRYEDFMKVLKPR